MKAHNLIYQWASLVRGFVYLNDIGSPSRHRIFNVDFTALGRVWQSGERA
jgi:hypothetical protein